MLWPSSHSQAHVCDIQYFTHAGLAAGFTLFCGAPLIACCMAKLQAMQVGHVNALAPLMHSCCHGELRMHACVLLDLPR